MGKSSKPATPPAPDYQALAKQQSELSRFNDVGPNGSVTWNGNTRTTSLSPEQQALYDQTVGAQQKAGGIATDWLGQLAPDATARSNLSDALYRNATKYYDTNFGNQEQSMRTQLLNSGVSEESEAYKRAMSDFNQRRDTVYGQAADSAALGAEQQLQTNQNGAVSRLLSLLNFGQPASVQSANIGQTPDLLGAASATYGAGVNSANATAAGNASANKGLGSALGAGAGFFFGGPVGAGIGSTIGAGLGGLF